MGCGNCGTGANGKPAGCKSNGGCSTGGCNRLNVFDWLSTLPLQSGTKPFPIVEVTFNKGSRKEFFRNNTGQTVYKDDWVCVEGVSGFDMGQVSLTGELVKLQMKKYGVQDQSTLKKILRPASSDDLAAFQQTKLREKEVMVRSRAITKEMKIDMKIGEVELQADGKKATFFYTADQRVDFRELIKVFANDFKAKIEMRQIGARQESGKVGGIGSCGRELCCSTWLTDFKSVNTNAARYQNLSINQAKLSGQCGRLKCCLNYELDTYMDALSMFPSHADALETSQGRASLIKKDIFRNLMWYSYPQSTKQYPLTIERVNEILRLNKQDIKPDDLQAVELEVTKHKENVKVDMGFVNDVGQLSLKSLEKRKSKSKGKKPQTQGQQPKKEGQQTSGGQGQHKPSNQGKQQPNKSTLPPKENSTGGSQQHKPRNNNSGQPNVSGPKKNSGGQGSNQNQRRPRPQGGAAGGEHKPEAQQRKEKPQQNNTP